ncbi:EVE domain-containing protein [Leptolyngbya sp. PCC 6406]|uniref:EVE domain-containing protein n=1 Tax=Leptolyngbya sp. PCC 6406 TaxID=1173264 RepID=UPI0021F12DEF|nr:EVE domain-containing protein [Leptolyngbya sp. PCC 6406]
MKSEPNVYSIEDLARQPEEIWDGVRNYQARNFLREMQIGDRAFFYHSNTKPPGIVGLMTILETDIVDPSQFDPSHKYYDPKSPADNPRWRTVKVGYGETFAHTLTLDQLKATFSPEELLVVKRGNRLSVMPIATPIAEQILAMTQS